MKEAHTIQSGILVKHEAEFIALPKSNANVTEGVYDLLRHTVRFLALNMASA